MKVEIKEAYHNIEDIKTLFEEYADSIGIDLAYQNYEQELKPCRGSMFGPLREIIYCLCGWYCGRVHCFKEIRRTKMRNEKAVCA